MKEYLVKGLSDKMDAEMYCADCEQASDIFEMFVNSEHYYAGDITSTVTGEVLCYFRKDHIDCGTNITYWTAK